MKNIEQTRDLPWNVGALSRWRTEVPAGGAVLWLLLVVLFPPSAQAVDTLDVSSPDPMLEDWRWTVFDKKDGLIGSVFAVFQDADHNIWFGTDRGVQRYDGLRWTTYTSNDGLVDSEVWAILQDREGQMWFGGKGAVSRLSFVDGDEVWTTFTFDTKGWVHHGALFQSRDGAIWAGFAAGRGGSIQRYADGAWSTVIPGVGRPDPNISRILELSDGSMWFGSLAGMMRRDGRRWTLDPIGRHSAVMTAEDTILVVTTAGEMIWYTSDSIMRVPQPAVGSGLRVAPDGTIWTPGRNQIARFDGEAWQVYPEFDERLRLGGYTSIQPVHGGMWLWSHGNASAVRFRSDERATYFTHPDSLDLRADGADGSIWLLQRSRPTAWETHIGAVESGKSVVRYKDDVWLRYTPADGVPEDATDIVRSSDGSIWVSGSHRGLGAVARLKDDRWTLYTERDGVIPGPYRLLATGTESVWVGGVSGSDMIASFDGERWTRYGPEDGYTGWRLVDALEASDGSTWVIGADNRRGNFTKYLNRQGAGPGDREWIPVRLLDGFPDTPKQLVEWPGGMLWVLTERHLLQVPLADAVNEPKWNAWTSEERINPKLHSLTATERGLYFAPVSVRNYGAVHFDGQVWNVLTEEDGLPGDGILRVHGGPDGVVWYVGRSGLSRYDPNDEGGGWTRYGGTHGIQPFRNDWGGQTVIDQGDGSVWVSDDGRVLRFRHADSPDPETELRTSVGRVSSEGNLQIQWRGSTMWNETPTSDLRYRYRLNGQDWVETDGTDVTFTSLGPGDYTFEVFAVAPTMRMEREPAVHTFTVEAPWWQDPRIAAPMLAFLLIGLIQTVRVVRSERRLRSANKALSDANNELFRVNQEISAQSERKSAFLASMSHELRTPMNAIKGFAGLVARREEGLTDQGRENLAKVGQASDHLLAQIDDLLDLSKIEAGKMEVNATTFDVRKTVSYCVSTVSPLVREAVELRTEVDPNVSTVRTDEQRVRQMVINLLSNAIKFTEAGTVVVSAGIDFVEGRQSRFDSAQRDVADADHLVISVADTGKGISAEEIPTLFDEYRQVSGQSESEVQRGTGLGLSITKRFAELLGGTIEVESDVGKGSTFTVRIPVVYSDEGSS